MFKSRGGNPVSGVILKVGHNQDKGAGIVKSYAQDELAKLKKKAYQKMEVCNGLVADNKC